jgi:cholesterol transport system auxiliary component
MASVGSHSVIDASDRKARRLVLVAIIASAFALEGCAGSTTLTSYDLASATPSHVRAGGLKGVLAVAEPNAQSSYDSTRIVVRTGPDELAYLSGAQWTEPLPRLIQERLIETFDNAKLLKLVGRPGILSEYSLHTDLRRFEIDVTSDQARVEIAARLVNDKTGLPIAAQVFSATAPAPHTADGAAAQALDAALRDAMRRIVVWSTAKI